MIEWDDQHGCLDAVTPDDIGPIYPSPFYSDRYVASYTKVIDGYENSDLPHWYNSGPGMFGMVGVRLPT